MHPGGGCPAWSFSYFTERPVVCYYDFMRQNVGDYSYEYKKRRQSQITRFVMLCLSIFLFLSLFLNFILFPIYTNNSSMEKGVSRNGISFVIPFLKHPERGDLVYISRMDGEKNPWYKGAVNTVCRFFTLQKAAPFGSTSRMTGKPSVRRVVALPGDSYYMKDYILYVRPYGQNHFLSEFELSRNEYSVNIYSVPVQWDSMGCDGVLKANTLGENEYFVLADDRVGSIDSRLYGPLDKGRIEGRVIMQVFPFNEMRLY